MGTPWQGELPPECPLASRQLAIFGKSSIHGGVLLHRFRALLFPEPSDSHDRDSWKPLVVWYANIRTTTKPSSRYGLREAPFVSRRYCV